jgi:hypothetical protein
VVGQYAFELVHPWGHIFILVFGYLISSPLDIVWADDPSTSSLLGFM